MPDSSNTTVPLQLKKATTCSLLDTKQRPSYKPTQTLIHSTQVTLSTSTAFYKPRDAITGGAPEQSKRKKMKQGKKLETPARHTTPVSPSVPVEAETTPRLPIRRTQSKSSQAYDQVSSLGNSKSASTKAKEQQGTQENQSPAQTNGFSIRKVRDKPAEHTTFGAAEKQVQTAPFETGAEPTLVHRALSKSASVETQAYRAAQREKNRARRKGEKKPSSTPPKRQQQTQKSLPVTVKIKTVLSRRPIAAEIFSFIARARISEKEVLRLTAQCHLATGTGKQKTERKLRHTRRCLARTERVRRIRNRMRILKVLSTLRHPAEFVFRSTAPSFPNPNASTSAAASRSVFRRRWRPARTAKVLRMRERERKFNREQKKARIRRLRGKFGGVRKFGARARSIQEEIEGWLGSAWRGGSGGLF